MSQQWKFDWQHVLFVLAFLAGFGWVEAPQFVGHPFSAVQLLQALLLLGSGIALLFKTSPKDLAAVLQAGEQAAQGIAAKRGFALLRLLGAIVVAGVLALLIFVPARRALRAPGVSVMAEGQGCAFWKQEQPKVVHSGSVDASCVLGAVLGGVTDPSLIAGKCAPMAVAQVIQTLSDLANFYLDQVLSTDAGVGASPPPGPGLPPSLDESQLARLIAARDKAVSEGTK